MKRKVQFVKSCEYCFCCCKSASVQQQCDLCATQHHNPGPAAGLGGQEKRRDLPRLFLKPYSTGYYCIVMASTGHSSAQSPQPVQLPGLTNAATSSTRSRLSVSQVSTQRPQPVQSSSLITGRLSLGSPTRHLLMVRNVNAKIISARVP